MLTKEKIADIKKQLELPLILAPMFLINTPEMVINACKSGIIGTFPALNARTSNDLDRWMQEITTNLDQAKKENPEQKIAPWGVNYIVHHSNKRYVEDLELIKKHQPPVVITSLGEPGPVVEVVKEYNGLVISDVINVKYAKKAIEKGADGLVLVSSGAGGHGGTYNPIAFMNEVREFFDGPIALSGGMSKGKDILAAEILGADLAYMGTRFIPTDESDAVEEYKKMILDYKIKDIIHTDAFSGIHANYLIPSIINAGLDPEKLKKKEKIDFSNVGDRRVKAWKDVWGAGQGIGSIDEIQSVSEVVTELKESYQTAKEEIAKTKTGIY